METIKKYFKEGLTAITALGTAYFYTILAITLFLSGFRTIAYHLAIGLIILYILVLILRIFYFKERPVKEDYFNLFTRLNAASFPSLHTTTSIYAATVLSTIANTGTIILFYSIALLIAYSRVYIKKHYWSDILAGLVLGIVAGGLYLYLI